MNKHMTEKGIALLIVLWVLTILMVIVLSFSVMARTEIYSTLAFKGGIERKFIAEAGIERGITELFYREVYKDQTIELEGREVWKTDGTPYEGQIGDGYYTVKILDESGKVDINTASELVLKNLLINAGVKPEEADIIVDCIMDWKDADDLHRLNGAESDYYMSLPNPYRAKDDKFDAIEELLLVKGMTAGILYGGGEKKGIIDFLTVHSGTASININAAPKEVIMALPGMTPEYADSIIEYRKTKEINDLSEIGLSGEGIELIMPGIDTQGTETFTIDAFGRKAGEKGVYAIRATVRLEGGEKYKYIYYKSPIETKQ
jgi:general secretion pathway protein K